ncbi:hypothetical protein MY11210_009217 [Beauveria gryllotalpidicola]
MVSSKRTDLRCQICGVSGNVGRMRLVDEPPEAASRRMRQGVPVSNETDCVGCFVVTDNGTADDDDDADISFVPEDEEDPKDVKYEYMPTPSDASGEDCFDDTFEDDDDDNEEDDGEMETKVNDKQYMKFLDDISSDTGNVIVPLTEEYKKRDQTWRSREHISGPNCVLRNAYVGHNITAQEFRGCNTFQLLCPKPSDWKSEKGDEDFEADDECPSYLSGLRDHLDSSVSFATVFAPMRHGQEHFHVHNWASAAGNRYLAAMPFHPACFEVFKRASLKRLNTIDVEGLAGWYKVEATYHFTDKIFPHDEAVRRATKDRVWDHVEGDEWITANPCFVPALHDEMQQLATDEPFVGPKSGETASLGVDTDNIAQMNLSSEPSPNLPQSFYFGHIRHDMPWIWETWCARPYSGWAATTQSAIAKDPIAVSHHRDYLKNWIRAIQADGDSSSTQKRAHLRHLNVQMKELEAKSQFVPEPTPVTLLPRIGTDWRRLYFALQNMGETSKGLRNRQRIWRCCNYILDRIALQRQKGKIAANCNVRLQREGQMVTGRGDAQILNFADDYSESEAEFSDQDATDVDMGDN